MDQLLGLAVELIEANFHRATAVRLAERAGLTDVLIFAQDPETGSMLPIGLPEPLPCRELWAAALSQPKPGLVSFPSYPDGILKPARVVRHGESAFALFETGGAIAPSLPQLLRLLAVVLALRMRCHAETQRAAAADRARRDAEESALALTTVQHRLDRANSEKRSLLRDLENRVALRTLELSNMSRALETTVYALAHRLRAPVRQIDAAAYLLGREAPSGAPLLSKIRTATMRLGALIDGLVEIADLGYRARNKELVDLSARARMLVETRGLGDGPRVRIEPRLRAYAYPELLDLMLKHLLDNALRHTRSSADPLIEIGSTGGDVFFVRDNGEGFEAESAEEILKPFSTLGSSSRLGLGLAVCDRIARLHGGRVWAVAAPGKGASIHFSLPSNVGSRIVDERSARLSCLEQIVDGVADAIVITDTELEPPGPRILSVNKAFENMTGWKASEILGKTPRVLQGPETSRAELARLKAALKRNERFFGEAVNYRKDGTKYFLQWHISTISDSSGRPLFYVSVQRDASDNRAAMQAALARADAARARAEEFENFAQMIAHDLRAPAGKIALYSELALKAEAGAQQPILQKVGKSAKALVTVIDALYQFVRRPESREIATLDISAIARDLARNLRRSDPQRDASINIQDGLIARGDALLVRVVLENLLSNAWKFTSGRPQARIEVIGALEGGALWISVRDNGPGFDEKLAERLFMPFSRLVSKSEFEGSGLGLSIVKNIVSALGGDVRARGKVNGGATFSFSLPSVV